MCGSYNCNAHPWCHEVWRFGIGLSWFLGEVSCKALWPWLHFQALHHIKPQRGRSDGVDPGRLGGISSFHASSLRWILNGASRFVIRTFRMDPARCFQITLISRSPCSSVGVDIPSVSSTSALLFQCCNQIFFIVWFVIGTGTSVEVSLQFVS